ncbi:MAG: [FeFe] hydrogenase H-cluster maturation GTPase HydF [Lachnospiraceae bacterium]|nr:[FeFe] hydrogenase H-cluster maturation GTPase HydF [Lachnospiraceae bacterium]
MNDTPQSERIHIGIFGCVNAGKSSIINAITDSQLAIVSDRRGTTTDPVIKSMEILPLGPVVLMDTPGYDDDSDLGELRIQKARQTLNRADIAVLVLDGVIGMTEPDETLLDIIVEKKIPYVIVYNKKDIGFATPDLSKEDSIVFVSAKTGEGIHELKELLGHLIPEASKKKPLVSDLISAGDMIVLVCPIDESAPKGRLILPQQMMIRDILDAGAMAVVTREHELRATLDGLGKKPAMVITDSQAFKIVDEIVPEYIPLTSFSILMARYKGFLETAIEGVKAMDDLKDGDKVLMAEGCTHHRQCNDIGTVKIPNWLKKHTGRDIVIETCSGKDFPEDLSDYSLIIHCGGCMITEREVMYRMKCAIDQGVPFTNYGTVIARMTGALERSIKIVSS